MTAIISLANRNGPKRPLLIRHPFATADDRVAVALADRSQSIQRCLAGSSRLHLRLSLIREPVREEAAMKGDDGMRAANARLRDKINEVLGKHPELRDVADRVFLEQGMHIQVGIPFLDRMHLNLQQRARAIIECRPDLERLFDD
ncbi:MAG: hypothetical protein WAN05_01765 [Roseiarcus sp.]|jgi:hypothetical protein